MANAFSKNELVVFEELLDGFEDNLVLSKNVENYTPPAQELQRAGNTIWRPVPYNMQVNSGTDITSTLGDSTQLSVPTTLDLQKNVNWQMTASDMNDPLQIKRMTEAAMKNLASAVNSSVSSVASLRGAVVDVKSTAAADFSDIAQIDTICSEIGIPDNDRYLTLNPTDYNLLAADLAEKEVHTGNVITAWERARLGMFATFETFKAQYTYALPKANGGGAITMDTQAGASNYYTPAATSTAATGQESNVDNRYQTVTVSSTASVAAGDCFTIAGVNWVHPISKADTGRLKTFRVISVTDGTHMVISSPIISNQGATRAEAMYQNCVVTPSATAAIVFLNTVAKPTNVFWYKGAIELLAGRLSFDTNAGVGIITYTLDNGIQVQLQKAFNILTQKFIYRMDIIYGVSVLNPDMAGIKLFGQT